jgi:hypothetical protein
MSSSESRTKKGLSGAVTVFSQVIAAPFAGVAVTF